MFPYTLFLSAAKYYRRHFSGAQLSAAEHEEMASERVGGRLWDALEEDEQKDLVKREIWKAEVYRGWLEARQANDKPKKKVKRDKGYEDSDDE